MNDVPPVAAAATKDARPMVRRGRKSIARYPDGKLIGAVIADIVLSMF